MMVKVTGDCEWVHSVSLIGIDEHTGDECVYNDLHRQPGNREGRNTG